MLAILFLENSLSMFMDLLNRVEPGLLIILLSPINWEGVLTCSYVSQPNDCNFSL